MESHRVRLRIRHVSGDDGWDDGALSGTHDSGARATVDKERSSGQPFSRNSSSPPDTFSSRSAFHFQQTLRPINHQASGLPEPQIASTSDVLSRIMLDSATFANGPRLRTSAWPNAKRVNFLPPQRLPLRILRIAISISASGLSRQVLLGSDQHFPFSMMMSFDSLPLAASIAFATCSLDDSVTASPQVASVAAGTCQYCIFSASMPPSR